MCPNAWLSTVANLLIYYISMKIGHYARLTSCNRVDTQRLCIAEQLLFLFYFVKFVCTNFYQPISKSDKDYLLLWAVTKTMTLLPTIKVIFLSLSDGYHPWSENPVVRWWHGRQWNCQTDFVHPSSCESVGHHRFVAAICPVHLPHPVWLPVHPFLFRRLPARAVQVPTVSCGQARQVRTSTVSVRPPYDTDTAGLRGFPTSEGKPALYKGKCFSWLFKTFWAAEKTSCCVFEDTRILRLSDWENTFQTPSRSIRVFLTVRVQSYALNTVSDSDLNRTMAAYRRNMQPLVEIQIQSFPYSNGQGFKRWKTWIHENREIQILIKRIYRIAGKPDTEENKPMVVRQFGDTLIQWFHDVMLSLSKQPKHCFTTQPYRALLNKRIMK